MYELAYRAVDALFMRLERRLMHQNRFLTRIPGYHDRKGGTNTVTEYAYTIGLMQALVHSVAFDRHGIEALDVGCGSGRLAHAIAPLLGSGQYIGIDINKADIHRAQRIWKRRRDDDPRISFVHLDHSNRTYAKNQAANFPKYPFDDNSFDLVTALSVWTHLNEADATFYFSEVGRVLRPGGKAVITFFYLDSDYEEFLRRAPQESIFSLRSPEKYLFDQPVDGSDDWRCPSWVSEPEEMTGVTPSGMKRLLDASGLKLEAIHPGNWRVRPGLFFQDVVVFSKT